MNWVMMLLQVEKLSMVPQKECKEALYDLLTAHHVHMRAFSATADFAPSKSVYLFRHEPKTMCDQLHALVLKEMINVCAHQVAVVGRLK